MNDVQGSRVNYTLSILIGVIIVSLIIGGVAGYLIGYSSISSKIDDMHKQLSSIERQMSYLQNQLNIYRNTNQTIYVSTGNVSIPKLYEEVKDSIVLIRGIKVYYDSLGNPISYTYVQGSGFVYNYSKQMVILTNYHVVYNDVNITVTFIDGDEYPATVIGSDPYADLAVLTAKAPAYEFKPIKIASSSTLKVGEAVVAVGNPFGLTGTITTGIISQLGRSISTELGGGYVMADIIQISAPINPGSSGGPLLNLNGQVIGITTAIVAGSQGIGFAIPSNTILREISYLVNKGTYNLHPWLGIRGVDMNYEIAKAMHTNVTYGWLVINVIKGGPADKAGLRGGNKEVEIAGERVIIGGDIIIGVNGVRVTGIDSLSSYLEEYTMPGQSITLTIVRDNQMMNITLILGARPPLFSSGG